jgi:uncharacterized protein DUF5985
MAHLVYILCAATAFACAVLLFRAWARSGTSLLLWAAICFAMLTVNNGLLYVDLVMVPMRDLSLLRSLSALVGLIVLLYGLVWQERTR